LATRLGQLIPVYQTGISFAFPGGCGHGKLGVLAYYSPNINRQYGSAFPDWNWQSNMTQTDLHNLIRPLLPEPCSIEQGDGNSVTLTGGAPGEVIVRITATIVKILAFTVKWDGPHNPVRVGVPVATVNLGAADLVAAVSAAVEKARRTRLATYRTCGRCDETNPPEWMHDA
jgi:hypothetical protein